MAQVAHNISLGSTTYQSPDSTLLVTVSVQHTLGVPNSTAEISVADPAANVKVGDAVSIKLGSEGSLSPVFKGVVQEVETHLEGVQVWAGSSAAILSRQRVDALFENESTGALIKAIVADGKATAGTAEDGLTFPRYVITREKSAWRHMRELAQYSGLDLYLDTEDKVNAKAYAESNGASFTYGENLLELEKRSLEVDVEGVVVHGDSPAGQGQSDEAVFWFKKEAVSGNAGKASGHVQCHTLMAARNQDLCKQIAQNLFDATQTQAVGRARVLGGEKVALGQTITFLQAPTSAMNGSYKVTAVLHELNPEDGFTTEITWEEPKA